MNARILSILDSKEKIPNVTRIGKTGEVCCVSSLFIQFCA